MDVKKAKSGIAFYQNDKITFNSINKVKINKPIFIKLNEEDKKYLERIKDGEYILQMSLEQYSIALKRLSKQYFDCELTQNDYRCIHTRYNFNKIGFNLELIEKYKKLNELCKENGHSFDTALNVYLPMNLPMEGEI